METIQTERRRCVLPGLLEATVARHESPRPRLRGWAALRWLLVLAIAGYLLFAHGCHADDDHDLFDLLTSMLH